MLRPDVGEKHVEEALVLAAPGEVHQEGVVDLLQCQVFHLSWF